MSNAGNNREYPGLAPDEQPAFGPGSQSAEELEHLDSTVVMAHVGRLGLQTSGEMIPGIGNTPTFNAIGEQEAVRIQRGTDTRNRPIYSYKLRPLTAEQLAVMDTWNQGTVAMNHPQSEKSGPVRMPRAVTRGQERSETDRDVSKVVAEPLKFRPGSNDLASLLGPKKEAAGRQDVESGPPLEGRAVRAGDRLRQTPETRERFAVPVIKRGLDQLRPDTEESQPERVDPALPTEERFHEVARPRHVRPL